MILFESDIQAKQIHDLPVPDKVECVWVLLQPKCLPQSVSTIAVCCAYNSTSSTREDEHELELHILESMDLLQTKYPDVSFVVLSDFNRMNINSILNAQSLKHIVYFPTRGQATLDKVLTSINKFNEKLYPYCPIGKSDHTCVVWNPRTHQSRKFTNKTRTYRPMKDSQIKEFGTWIQSQDWCDILQADSTQLKTDVFYKTVNQAIDMHFPNVTVKCHSNDKPWMNKKIKALIHSHQQAFSSDNVTVYKKLHNQVKREIEKSKINYYANRVRNLQTIEPRKWDQEIRTMTRNVKSDLCIPVPGIEDSEHGDIANYINDAFVNVSSGISPLDIATLESFLPACSPAAELYPWEVYAKLKRLKQAKQVALMGFHLKLLRNLSMNSALLFVIF